MAATDATVLIVDDDPDVLELMRQLVANAGYRVLTAGGGVQALEILERTPPDALVLDLMMPDRGGIDLLEHVRWHPRFADLPVVCVSAVPQDSEALQFVRDFSGQLLDKMNLDQLVERVTQGLAAKPD